METNSNIVQDASGRVALSFMAIDKRAVSNIVKPTEVVSSSRDYVLWGKMNNYPDYLNGLRKAAATLQSIISGCVDYTCGDRITGVGPYLAPDGRRYMNRLRHTFRDVIKNLSRDYFTYGGFAFQVIRANDGSVAEIYWLDFRFIRTNKECSVFWYSEDWSRRFGKKTDIVLPRFDRDSVEVPESVVYWKNTDTQVYPECPFEGATLAAELERAIDEYHWNSMNNSFMGAYLVNFLNGIPSDEVRAEIEKNWRAKMDGFQNAGRTVFNYAIDKDHMAILQELKSSDFGEKYQTLAKRARQQLFTAYRANPNLFGIPTENLGFSNEEYEGAFKLFNRTVIQPAQRAIIDALQGVYDANVTITPFTLAGDTETTQTAE